MNDAAETAAYADTIPPADLPKQCSGCGSVLTAEEWMANPRRRLWHFADETLEIEEHACGSTLAIPVLT